MAVRKKTTKNKKATPKSSDVATRDRLISSAIKIFAEKGLEGARVQDILKAANINISMISYYFGGKEGLYLECVKKAANSGVEASARILIPPTTAEEFKIRIGFFFEELMRFSAEHPDEVMLLRNEGRNPTAAAREILSHITDDILKFFKSAQKNKVVKSSLDPKVLATIFFTMIISLSNEAHIVKEFNDGKDTSDKELRDSIQKHLLLCTSGILQ